MRPDERYRRRHYAGLYVSLVLVVLAAWALLYILHWLASFDGLS